jgi:hypothetical protein
LSLVKASQQPDFTPWARLAEESEAEWQHFNLWLNLNPRVPPLDPALAIRHNWSERAAAFDSFQLIKGLAPSEAARNIFAMWSHTVLNETRKWFGKSLRSQSEPVLPPGAVGEFIDLVTDPTRNQQGKEKYNLEALDAEETEQLLKLLEKAAIK